MDSEKVDLFMANEVRKDEAEHPVLDFEGVPTIELVRELKARGYQVKRENECETCGQVIDGPHYCPGRRTDIMVGWPEK